MKIKNQLSLSSLLGLSSILLFSACDTAPEACFTVDHTLVDLNEAVQFDDCTEPLPQSYVWNFDDGSTSNEANPIHAFSAEGQYLVSLTAKAKSEINDDAVSTVIKVGQRLLQSIQIVSLPATQTNGLPWDSGDAPDLGLSIRSGGVLLYDFAPIVDCSTFSSMTLSFPGTDLLPPQATTFEFYDDDAGSRQSMASFSVDLNTFVPEASKTIHLGASPAEIIIQYSLR